MCTTAHNTPPDAFYSFVPRATRINTYLPAASVGGPSLILAAACSAGSSRHRTSPAAAIGYYSSLFAGPDHGRILGLMTKDVSKVTFDLRPVRSGTGWYVVATYPGSQQEHIPGFKTEAEAVEWLASSRCQAWLKARGYAK